VNETDLHRRSVNFKVRRLANGMTH